MWGIKYKLQWKHLATKIDDLELYMSFIFKTNLPLWISGIGGSFIGILTYWNSNPLIVFGSHLSWLLHIRLRAIARNEGWLPRPHTQVLLLSLKRTLTKIWYLYRPTTLKRPGCWVGFLKNVMMHAKVYKYLHSNANKIQIFIYFEDFILLGIKYIHV
jgi:hypothetical protein